MSLRHDIESLGWTYDVDEDTGEFRLEHPDTDTAYVLDEEGGLRVPGNGEVGGDLQRLQETLDSAIGESEAVDGGADQITDCQGITCSGGRITISPGELILNPSVMRIKAGTLEMESNGNASLDAGGIVRINGAVIKLN